jgi:hypothetical protein
MNTVTVTLHEDLCTYLVTSLSVLLRMRNPLDKNYRENTHILLSITFENRAVYEITWKKVTDDNMAHVHCMLNT